MIFSKATTTLLDECRTPTHCSESDIRAQLAPILDIVAAAQKQTAVLRQQALAAEMADETGAHASLYEPLHQKCDAVDKRVLDLTKAARELRGSVQDLQKVADGIVESLAPADPTPAPAEDALSDPVVSS